MGMLLQIFIQHGGEGYKEILDATLFMIPGNNTIGKHFMKPMPYCFDAMCWSSILKPSQTLEGTIELIIGMFLQLRESKIVYHL